MAILQKYIDQGISVNTSYNPVFFEDEKIPMSVMLQHLIMFYKMESNYTTLTHSMDRVKSMYIKMMKKLKREKILRQMQNTMITASRV